MIFGTRKVESLGYRMVEKKLPKSSTAWVGCTNVTDRQTDRQTDDRRQTELRRLLANVNASSRPLKSWGGGSLSPLTPSPYSLLSQPPYFPWAKTWGWAPEPPYFKPCSQGLRVAHEITFSASATPTFTHIGVGVGNWTQKFFLKIEKRSSGGVYHFRNSYENFEGLWTVLWPVHVSNLVRFEQGITFMGLQLGAAFSPEFSDRMRRKCWVYKI